MLSVFAEHAITIIRAGETTGRYGDEIPDWGDVDRSDVSGLSVQRVFGDGDTMLRDAGQSEYTVYAPPGTDVTAYDRIEWNGTVHEVNGRPSVWNVGMGLVDHVAIHINVWEG